ncbi:MAG: hypothetical protein P8Y49_03135 [Sulfurovaceae bacterium]
MKKIFTHTLLVTLLGLFVAGCNSQPSVSQATAEKIEQKLATVESLKGSQIQANKVENAIVLSVLLPKPLSVFPQPLAYGLQLYDLLLTDILIPSRRF